MTKKKLQTIIELIDAHYPDTVCYLEYEKDYELLFATILSAQCTDERVNQVTKGLFKKYPDLESFAASDIKELEQDVKPTGFYHNKALHIKEAAAELLSRFNGKIPCGIDELTSLPGVGRKTANVVRSHVFREPGIVVDTHVKRVSRRLGLTDTLDPVKAEYELMDILPRDHWIPWNTQIIKHGREICRARKPECAKCFLAEVCESAQGGNCI
ncbi:MAG: endonuclease III [Lachnospiraceae bacterium]|nr:endonuclease III [Lachnospiraceae bacterium]